MGNVIKYRTHVVLCLVVALVFAIKNQQKHVLMEPDRIYIDLALPDLTRESRLFHVSGQQPSTIVPVG